MVSDGIKAAQIQAQYSPLINSTRPGLASRRMCCPPSGTPRAGWTRTAAPAARSVATPVRRAGCSAAARRADLLEPRFHCVWTHWIRDFMAFHLARRIRNVMLMVPAW